MNGTSGSNRIEKILSANDCGSTGAHQAGILVPKETAILDFFPHLDSSIKNPREFIDFFDDSKERHRFCFIYYNSRPLGCGTRDEYRLTRMTSYINGARLIEGDMLVFTKDQAGYHISFQRKQQQASPVGTADNNSPVILLTSGRWKVIRI